MKKKIKSAVSDARKYLEQLTKGGVIGVRNCQYVALIAANLELISEEIAKIETESAEGLKDDKSCDNTCGQ